MLSSLLLDPLSKSGREAAIKASEWRHCKDKTCAQKFMSKQAIHWAESQESAVAELKSSKYGVVSDSSTDSEYGSPSSSLLAAIH